MIWLFLLSLAQCVSAGDVWPGGWVAAPYPPGGWSCSPTVNECPKAGSHERCMVVRCECPTGGCLFSDGFESGDTGAWALQPAIFNDGFETGTTERWSQ